MQRSRILKALMALFVGIAAPTVLALLYSAISGDPTFRPLGVSHKALLAFENQKTNSGLRIDLIWGAGSALQQEPEAVTNMLANALRAHDVEGPIDVVPDNGSNVRVLFHVGQQSFGPYPLAEAGRGVTLAVGVLKFKRQGY